MTYWPDHFRPEPKGSKMDPNRRRDLVLSYAVDWAFAIGLWIVFALIDKIDGFKRQFSLTDTSIQHTYAVHERIPVWALVVIAGLVPLVIILFVALIVRRSFWDAHNGVLGLLLAWSFTWITTEVIKITVGRPRPDLIDRCQPAAGSTNADVFGLATSIICTRTDLLKDGFRSFPSGHSSSSFAGLGYLSFFLAGKLHLFDGRGHSLKSWVCLAPLLGALLVAISRTMDYRHHATDVIVGSILGFLIGLWSYYLYYPALNSPNCHLPYSPRIPALNYGSGRPTDLLPVHSGQENGPKPASGPSAELSEIQGETAPRLSGLKHFDDLEGGRAGT